MKRDRRYVPSTVISAQRSVLEMVEAQIEQMPEAERNTLRVDRGTGTITWSDVLRHVKAALALRVKRS